MGSSLWSFEPEIVWERLLIVSLLLWFLHEEAEARRLEHLRKLWPRQMHASHVSGDSITTYSYSW